MYIESRLQRVRLIRTPGYCEQINSYWASALSLITMLKSSDTTNSLGCACFPECLQNFSEHQILWSLCSVVFYALTLRLPILTSLSVSPELKVCVRSGEKVKISGKQECIPVGCIPKAHWPYLRISSYPMHTPQNNHAHPPGATMHAPPSNQTCPRATMHPPRATTHAPQATMHATLWTKCGHMLLKILPCPNFVAGGNKDTPATTNIFLCINLFVVSGTNCTVSVPATVKCTLTHKGI